MNDPTKPKPPTVAEQIERDQEHRLHLAQIVDLERRCIEAGYTIRPKQEQPK